MLERFRCVDNRVDAKIIASDVYDTVYGIYDHLRPGASIDRPLASVAMYDVEDLTIDDLRRYLMRQYLDAKILTLFGYTFDQFIRHTREEIDMMVEEGKRYRTQQDSVQDANVNSVLKQINSMR